MPDNEMTHDDETITIATMLTSCFLRHFDIGDADNHVVESMWTVATEVKNTFVGSEDAACIAFRADRDGQADLMAHLSETYTAGESMYLNVVARDLAAEIERYLRTRYRTGAEASGTPAPVPGKALPAGFTPVGDRLPEDGALVLGLRESGYQSCDFEVVTVKHLGSRYPSLPWRTVAGDSVTESGETIVAWMASDAFFAPKR